MFFALSPLIFLPLNVYASKARTTANVALLGMRSVSTVGSAVNFITAANARADAGVHCDQGAAVFVAVHTVIDRSGCRKTASGRQWIL